MVILIIIALICFIYAFCLLVKGLFLLLKAVFYLYFANEKQIEKAYENNITKETEEYKRFEKNLDGTIERLINPDKYSL